MTKATRSQRVSVPQCRPCSCDGRPARDTDRDCDQQGGPRSPQDTRQLHRSFKQDQAQAVEDNA